MKHMATAALPQQRKSLDFSELIRDFDAATFDEVAPQLLLDLDAAGTELSFYFERLPAPAGGRSQARSYRAEVARIPTMNRAEEQRFAMGIELLWLRLQKARREAGFDGERVAKWPDATDTRCLSCAPGDELDCFGCAPGECSRMVRARLRTLTQDLVMARNEMVERHLYIVFRLLDRYRNVGVPQDDMIQDANEAMFRAVQGFDFRRGVRFKTYAGYWVNQAFLNAIYNQSRTVRVPAYIQKAMKKISQAVGQIEGGVHDVRAVAKSAKVEEKLVRQALQGNRYTLSLNRPAVGEDGAEMVDFVEDENMLAPEPEFGESSMLADHLHEAVGRLSQREQTVLGMRFGLDGKRGSTLAEVGRKLGISLERVRQIQRAALDKLRGGDLGRRLEQFV